MKLSEDEKRELRSEIQRVVDYMVQADAAKDAISSLLKDIKEEYGIPATVARKVATTIRKEAKELEEEKWDEFRTLLEICE